MISKIFKNNLLQGWEYEGFPIEYILARIRGKRTGLIVGYGDILYSQLPYESLRATDYSPYLIHEDIEYAVNRLMEAERRRLFRLADYDLKAVLEPVLMFFELENLKTVLRGKANNYEKAVIEASLGPTILRRKILNRLIDAEDIHSCINAMIEFIPEIEKPLREAIPLYKEKEDLFLIELNLEKGLLEYVIGHISKRDRALRAFFEFNIDYRNLRTAFKLMNWNIRKYEQSYVNGGRLKSGILRRVANSKDFYDALSNLEGIHMWRYIRGAGLYLEIENRLDDYSLIFFKRLSREPSGIGLIVGYLWRRHIEAKALRLIFHGMRLGLEKGEIEREVTH